MIAVVLAARDKNAAINNKRRVKERTLIIVSLLGGAAAMLFALLVFRHKVRRLKFMVGIPFIILMQIGAIMFVFNSNLSVGYYEIKSEKISGEIKLALIADLHSCAYGDGQNELVRVIEAERPDAILFAGDIFDDDLPPGHAARFISEIAGKYPCFYVTGNHEFWSGSADEYKEILESHGVKVLEGTSEILEVNGNKIRISGIDDLETDKYQSRSISYASQLNLLSDTPNYDGLFNILLSHRPERIHEYLPFAYDLVLSGHAHGGQWRIPYILNNGLLSPNQGLFPKYTNGKHLFGDTVLIVSRGLARESTPFIPRIFNRPEIVVVVLKEMD